MYLDELLSGDFYEEIGPEHRHASTPGQICHAPIIYTHEHHEIWRPTRYDDSQTLATSFKIEAAGKNAYRRMTPLQNPPLKTREEFPVIRAKYRRVVLMRPAPATIPLKPLKREYPLNRPLTVVLPCYGIAGPFRRAKFPPEFVERVRKLEYPESFFLPEHHSAISKDSLLYINRMTNVYQSNLEPLNWKLSEQVLRLLQGQVRYYLTGEHTEDYANAREMLMHPEDESLEREK